MNDQTKPDTAVDADADAAASMATTADAAAQTETASVTPANDAAATSPAPAPADAPKGRTKAKAVDADQLQRLISDIEARNHSHLRETLLNDLRDNDGARCTDANQTYTVKLAGITTSATSGFGLALANWCAKARRTLLGLED